jgi:hypothetical protein
VVRREIAYGGDEEWGIHVDAGGKNKAPAYFDDGAPQSYGAFHRFRQNGYRGPEAEVLARAESWIDRWAV